MKMLRCLPLALKLSAISSALCALVIKPAAAETVRFVDLQGFSRLLEGDAHSVSISEDGAIGLTLSENELFASTNVNLGTATLWHGEIVASQIGETARVLSLNDRGQERVLLDNLDGRIVTKLIEKGDDLVVALAPKPELIYLSQRGKRRSVLVPDVGFVWDMVPSFDGGLIVATGEPGRVMKLSQDGAWSVLFESDEAHIKALAIDDKLGLFAGGGQKGIVYHAAQASPMRALYDSGNAEVTALVVDGNFVYAATVTGAQAAVTGKSDDTAANKVEVHSSVARISMLGAAEMLAGSNDEIVFDLLREKAGSVLLATGAVGRKEARGRLYRLDANKRSISLLHQSQARRLTQLFKEASGRLLVLGQEGTRLVAFADQAQSCGCYVSAVFDTGIHSTFGTVQALGSFPKGSSATLSVRTGQTPEPDNSWSLWSPTTDAQLPSPCQAPPGRFAQVRLRLRAKSSAPPEVVRLRLSYLRQNLAPFVRDISVIDKGLTWAALPSRDSNEEMKQKIIALGGGGGDETTNTQGQQEGRRFTLRARQTAERGALTVRWLTDDANGDELSYTLWMRPLQLPTASNAPKWQLLADNMSEPFFSVQSQQLADGYYVFRVRASDARSNPLRFACSDERVSRAILVDNTPPVFSHLAVRTARGRTSLQGQVSDAAGLLTALQIAVDHEPLRPWAPKDGVLDGPTESLDGDLGPLAAGAHTLTLVAQDEAQNDAFASLTFTVSN